jgi:O-antigen/teichoic acid export membrane protein
MSANQIPMSSQELRREVLSVGKYSLVYVIGQGVSRAVGFLMIPVYTRFIAPSSYGAMELLEILTAAALMLVSLGVAESMSRFYYAEHDPAARDRVISTIFLGFAAAGLPIILLLLTLAPSVSALILEEAQYAHGLQIALAGTWFSMLGDLALTYLRMRYMAKTFVAITTIQLVLALSLNVFFVVHLQWDILGIFYSTLITQALTGTVLALITLRKVGLGFSFPVFQRLIGFGLPLVPSQIALMLGFCSNRFFLRWFHSADPVLGLALVGIYSLGHKFGVIVNRFINVPFNSFWGPRRLELLLRDGPGAKATVARMCTYATLCAVVFALVLSTAITPMMALIAEKSYQGCESVIPCVALAYVVVGLESHFRAGMLYKRKTVLDTWISMVSIAIILAWNWIFVPRYGLLGAATANLAGLSVRAALIYFVSQRLYHIPFEMGRIAIMLITACALYAGTQLITLSSPWTTLLARMVLVTAFPLALYFARFYHEGELEFAFSLLRRRRKLAEGALARI